MRRLLAALVVVAVAACGGQAADPAALYGGAREGMLRGELEAADALIQTALEADPDAALAAALRLLRAEIRLLERDIDGAGTIIDAPLPAIDATAAGRLEARRLYLDGYRLMARGAIAAGLTQLDASAVLARRWGATDVALDADVLAGQALYRLGRPDEADARLLAARTEAAASGLRARELAALGTLGMGQLVRERFDAALHWFEQALSFTAFEDHLSYAAALLNAGVCHARLGNFTRALELQRRAVELHQSRQVTTYLEQALGELGHTLFLAGDAAAAVDLLQQARALAAAAGRTANETLWLDSAATALIDLGRWDDAERLNRESLALKQARGRAGSDGPNLVNAAQIAAGRGNPDQALVLLREVLARSDEPAWVRWQAHATAADVLVGAGQRDEGLREFERALGIVETMRTSLLEPEYRITFLSRMMHFYRAYVDALASAGDATRALEVADASRARVLAERFGAEATARTGADALVARVAGAGVTALVYWLAPSRSLAWRVDAGGVQMVELPGADEIDRLVDDHRTFIERSLGDPRRSTAPGPGDRLAEAVLTPLLADASGRPAAPTRHPAAGPPVRVVIVPDGSLYGVNFETLPVGPDRAYWIETASISVAPALALLDARRAQAVVRAPSVLLVGDPEAPDLPPLRHAAAEIEAIRQALGTSDIVVQRGADATPAAFLDAAPERFSVIHFAAHATASAASPLDSSIELAADRTGRFKLYARDVAERPLAAELVTLSACRGAGDRTYPGEGAVGLAWAFLRAGAARVIASLWDVDDRSTALLMGATYDGLARGLAPADALRQAKLALLAGGGNFAKPYYWAPFQVFTAAP